MKKQLLFFSILLLLTSCASVEKHNLQITKLHAVADLHDDVDKAYKQLKRHHPHLYQFTSKEVMDTKFDSLKTAITQPMDSRTFYKKLAVVTKSVGQGHMTLGLLNLRRTKQERKALIGSKFDVNNLDFDYLDDKLWIVNTRGKDSVLVGSEVLSIDQKTIPELVALYKKRLVSDGYNTTYYNRVIGKRFLTHYAREFGRFDSIAFRLKTKDSVFTKTYKRLLRSELEKLKKDTTKVDSIKLKTPKKKLTKAEKKAKKIKYKAKRKHNQKYGYNAARKEYTRNLNFVGKDSSVAVMKIRGFTNGKYKEFYEESFAEIDKRQSKALVIDLRDNFGGRLNEISYLYGYLTDKDYVMINPSEVNSRIPYLKQLMSNSTSVTTKIIAGLFSPIIVPLNVFRTSKKDGKLYYKFKSAKSQEPKPHNYKGPIYVLINGNSFSASSILSTQLDGNNRATFVGEETGGAYNGTVAGIYKTYKLPNSKVRLRIGLMHIDAPFKKQPDGYGVKPDVEITPTLKDRLENRDPELQWVLKNIESKK
ncbi:S41 family peptidase [Winogradskyella immobilis]|uniref:Peptidase S41 n=1 Tax=Winogradskyella immobilis TaxID=2816852 RepID=A0ABS8EMV4_9FLAO|nr:S41 family peptidase [Winogradskyella immobilis]MCC1483642.1 peptidase S41 [Winogradskyella immobilis]MCG0015736.1 S41 family peptidase [Winogradskyella immobilis]